MATELAPGHTGTPGCQVPHALAAVSMCRAGLPEGGLGQHWHSLTTGRGSRPQGVLGWTELTATTHLANRSPVPHLESLSTHINTTPRTVFYPFCN